MLPHIGHDVVAALLDHVRFHSAEVQRLNQEVITVA